MCTNINTQAHFITTLPRIELQSHLVDTTRAVQVIPLHTATSAMSVQEALFTFVFKIFCFRRTVSQADCMALRRPASAGEIIS